MALLKIICNGQINKFLTVCAAINFPVALDKTVFATTRMTFLGFLIDTVMQTVSIPVNKVLKGKQFIQSIVSRKNHKATVKEMQKLCGFLNFLCRCIVPGCTFTRRLYVITAQSYEGRPVRDHCSKLRRKASTLSSYQTVPGCQNGLTSVVDFS